MFLEELADLKDRFPARLQLLHVLSREEQESELLSGRLDRERLGRLLGSARAGRRGRRVVPVRPVRRWSIEGKQALLAAGADPATGCTPSCSTPTPRRRARRAPRGTSAGPRDGHGRAARADHHACRSTRTGRAVLDALLAVRPDAPYACKGGVCGTCRARVVSGAVEMDVNYALEPDEIAAGVVLTCQSHPTTDEVRLSFL